MRTQGIITITEYRLSYPRYFFN